MISPLVRAYCTYRWLSVVLCTKGAAEYATIWRNNASTLRQIPSILIADRIESTLEYLLNLRFVFELLIVVDLFEWMFCARKALSPSEAMLPNRKFIPVYLSPIQNFLRQILLDAPKSSTRTQQLQHYPQHGYRQAGCGGYA